MDYLSDLNPAQREAVTHTGAPLLIVAGAGTGKTTVIARRIAHLIGEKLAKPEEILAVTFTEKAAGEMEERVDRLMPYGYMQLWISTFHSFCQKVLEAHGLHIGLPVPFKVMAPTDAWILIRENLKKFELDYYRPMGNPARFIHALIAHFARAKDEGITPEKYLEYATSRSLDTDTPSGEGGHAEIEETPRLMELAAAYHTYAHLLLEHHALDFGDLIFYTLKLFRERPRIRAHYRTQFKYILVDEFQDTNLAQYELIKLLAGQKIQINPPSVSSPYQGGDWGGPHLTVVGDDNQSIYKFRGASISNILKFKEDFPEAKELVLTENYRSRQTVLEVAYRVIQNNNPYTLESRLGISKNLRAVRDGEATIECIHARDERHEAKKIAQRIAEIASSERTLLWSDFGILVRARAHADYIVQALERAHIPFHFIAANGLFSEAPALDIHAYLRVLIDPQDSVALYRVLNLPIFKLADTDVLQLTHHAHKKSKPLIASARDARTIGMDIVAVQCVEEALGLIGRHTALARTARASKVVLAFLHDSGYLETLIERERALDAHAAKALIVLRRLFEKIEQFETTSEEKTVRAYLAHLDCALESGDEGGNVHVGDTEGPESVKIMTIHAAKGLEFRHVIVPHLVEQRFPTSERKEAIELPKELVNEILPESDWHLMEERRLFYVALTRARDGLILTWADTYGQGTRTRKPSRFLEELGVSALANTTRTDAANELHELTTPVPNAQGIRDTVAGTAPVPPTHFSYTKLKAYETCPLQYKFAHVLKIPVRGRASFSFGKTMHIALQKFYEQIIAGQTTKQTTLFPETGATASAPPPVPSLEELLALYEASWIDDWFEDEAQKEAYREHGKKILKVFYEKHAREGWGRPRMVEAPFHLKMGSYTIKGAMDRIDETDDGIEIIDYKTGAPKDADDLTFEDKEQLLIYQRASSGVYRLQPSVLTFYYLQNNSRVSFLGTPKELEKVEKKILGTIEEIASGDFTPTPSPFTCRSCDFRDICSFRQLS